MGNAYLTAAKRARNDEFYTRYADVEAEMAAYVKFDPDVFRGRTVLLPCDDPDRSAFAGYFTANFGRFGLERLVSTSYVPGGHGRLLILERGGAGLSGRLAGDGDFRSAEVTALRDGADVVVTNPPFSLFRDFMDWLFEGGVGFSVLGNVNAATYKRIFPRIRDGALWLGRRRTNRAMYFDIPAERALRLLADGKAGSAYGIVDGVVVGRLASACWFTNLGLDRRREPLPSGTMARNLASNRRLREKLERDYGTDGYPRYDNYDAIEVPFADAIPCDYAGVMGVPVTFLDRYDPERFELIGASDGGAMPDEYRIPRSGRQGDPTIGGRSVYKRLFIRNRHPQAGCDA